MRIQSATAVVTTAFSMFAGVQPARAQDEAVLDHDVVVGIGGATEFDIHEGAARPGCNVFLEWEAIDEWLELELGVSLLTIKSGYEVPVELLFKKPFELSSSLELMLGLGPQVSHSSVQGRGSTTFAATFAVDLMYWPSQRLGLWLEPTYDVPLQHGSSGGAGFTAGGLVGW